MKRILYIGVPIGILIALIGWRFVQNRQLQAAQLDAAARRKKAPPVVRVAVATVRDIVHAFQGVASVEAPYDVRVAPKFTGRLEYLQVREGAEVKRGQVLARLEPTEINAAINQQQAAVSSAQANLANARVRYGRMHKLLDLGAVSAQDTGDARTQVAVQEAAVNGAVAQLHNLQAQLSDTILRAPVDGFVAARFVDPGSIVGAGQAVVTVQAIRRVYVTTSSPEATTDIRPGMPAHAELDAVPGKVFAGKVAEVSPSADPASRQFLLRAIFDNPRYLVRPGMFGRLSIITRVTREAVVVPHEAIKQDKQGQYVSVVDDGMKAHRRPVQTGDEDPGGIQVVSGVAAGDKVVVLSAQPVKDGQLVRIERGGQKIAGSESPAVVGGGGGASQPPSQSGTGPAPTFGTPSAINTQPAASSAGTSRSSYGFGSVPMTPAYSRPAPSPSIVAPYNAPITTIPTPVSREAGGGGGGQNPTSGTGGGGGATSGGTGGASGSGSTGSSGSRPPTSTQPVGRRP